ncbi:MAG: ferrous iron transport protein B [Sphingobacteriales bacterium]|nr:MAG: ferrous iron transport protein B [Sphingobacteriales bacterium]
MQRRFTIALVGNPNSGKSSLFNALTGLNQKVGNFPGVTVDKKTGSSTITDSLTAQIIDLPGTYSLYPKSADEQVTCEVLLNPDNTDRPDMVVVIADAANLKRNLLFCSQIMDLKIPVVIALTMNDIARKKGISIELAGLERMMGVPVVAINPRKNKGIGQLKKAIADVHASGQKIAAAEFIDTVALTGSWILEIKQLCKLSSAYSALHTACNYLDVTYLNAAQRIQIGALADQANFHKAKVQAEEIMQRYQRIGHIMQQCVVEDSPLKRSIMSERIDKLLLHPLWGNLVLLVVLFLLFQSIFWLAEYPMDWVEAGFSYVSGWLGDILPEGIVKDILINGLLAGISGIAVFIPQIMLLFGFITILEDSGYMARISFLTDRLMRSVGLNGRSVMPLISGMACAVPAIMAARTIQNRKERLITIMVTPLMSCSARLPVYTILIGLVIPDKSIWIFNLQGLVLMGLYLLGFFMALLVAWVLHIFIKVKERTFFLMELPVYRAPRWKNVGITMIEKAKIFVLDAGKVIMVISLLLWALASFGPPGRIKAVEERYAGLKQRFPNSAYQLDKDLQTAKLENSFAGIMGHGIEPFISPLGYDWKIGIALITSFAAREVFVGTMATLYSVADDDNVDATLRDKMRSAQRADGTPVYTLAAGLSLLVFYVFSMQCMSTLAIVKRETQSWVYPLVQFVYMFVIAYLSAFAMYQLFS